MLSQRFTRNALLLDFVPDGELQIDGIFCPGGSWRVGEQVMGRRKIINHGRFDACFISLVLLENPPSVWWLDWPKNEGIVSDSIVSLVLSMLSLANQPGVVWKMEMDAYRGLLLSLLQEADEQKASLKFVEYEKIQRAGDLLVKWPDSIPTVAELIGMSGVKTCRFQKGFRIIFGLSVRELIQQIKMKRAYHRLLLDGENIQVVAKELEYRQVANLGTAFRRYFGVTPNEAKRYFFS